MKLTRNNFITTARPHSTTGDQASQVITVWPYLLTRYAAETNHTTVNSVVAAAKDRGSCGMTTSRSGQASQCRRCYALHKCAAASGTDNALIPVKLRPDYYWSRS